MSTAPGREDLDSVYSTLILRPGTGRDFIAAFCEALLIGQDDYLRWTRRLLNLPRAQRTMRAPTPDQNQGFFFFCLGQPDHRLSADPTTRIMFRRHRRRHEFIPQSK